MDFFSPFAPNPLSMTSLNKLRDWALLLACNIIWGTQFVVYKRVQQDVGPLTAALLAIGCATLLLIPLVHYQARRSLTKDRKITKRRMPTKDVFAFILIGLAGQVVAQCCVAMGVRFTLASNAALLGFALPVSTALMAYMLLGERMNLTRWISFMLALAGVVVSSGIRWTDVNLSNKRFLLGNMLIFLAVNGGAFYNVYSKKLLTRYSPLQVLLYSYYVVIVFLLPVTIYAELHTLTALMTISSSAWAGIVFLGVCQYFLAMVIFLSVLTRLDATQAALSNYLIPFVGVLTAAIVFHEKLTAFMIVGGMFVLVSTLLMTVYENARRPINNVPDNSILRM
jgi:drug/metabolite transporter (DMT)-like permease